MKFMVARDARPSRTETVEQFLARGGTIKRIDGCPDPEGRVVRRGHFARSQRPSLQDAARSGAGRRPGLPQSAKSIG